MPIENFIHHLSIRNYRNYIKYFYYIIPICIAGLSVYYFLVSYQYVSTDNAYVKLDRTDISSFIQGEIKDIYIKENQIVQKNDVLITLDEIPYRIAYDEAKSNLKTVENQIRQLQATYDAQKEQHKIAKEIVNSQERILTRQEELSKNKIVPLTDLDAASMALEKARKEVDSIYQNLVGLEIQLDGALKGDVQKHPLYAQAKFKLDKADFDLSKCTLTAPTSGIVTKVDAIQKGEIISVGKPLFTIIAQAPLWIEANFKETELIRIKPGLSAEITVDTYPGIRWKAVVHSISPGTGSTFSLLPVENATGNWVKVIQRIPVRLEIVDTKNPEILRTGMSTTVTINIDPKPAGTSP